MACTDQTSQDPIDFTKFWKNLRKDIPRAIKKREPEKIRTVPAFSLQLNQKNVMVLPPARSVATHYPVGNTLFRKYCECGKLPVRLEHKASGYNLDWAVKYSELKPASLLPMFYEGLTEVEHPYAFFAVHGIYDLLFIARIDIIIKLLPKLIFHIRNALKTGHDIPIEGTMNVLINMVKTSDKIGHALLPYYRHFLGPLNNFIDKRSIFKPACKTPQNYKLNSLFTELLELLEKSGGPHAYINIKYMVPTYESSVILCRPSALYNSGILTKILTVDTFLGHYH